MSLFRMGGRSRSSRTGCRIAMAALAALLLALMISLLTAGCSSPTATDREPEGDTFNVGHMILELEYENPEGDRETATTAVWYPTYSEPRSYTYKGADDHESMVAMDAPLAAGGPYPLIIFAHGGYGSGYDSAFLMEYLVGRGYIAVALDYKDTKPFDYEEQVAFARIKEGNVEPKARVLRVASLLVDEMNQDRELLYWYLATHRLDPTTFIINKMHEFNGDPDSIFYQAIDEEAVGICGHSLGGLTSEGMIGAYPDQAFTDDRIKAALILSAPTYPFEQTIGNIDIPIMFMVGDNDETTLGAEFRRRLAYDLANPPKYMAFLQDATHFAFTNRVCGEAPLYIAMESNPQANAICRYGYDFFQGYLLGDSSALEQLEEPDAAFAYYVIEPEPGEVMEWGEEPPPNDSSHGGIREEFSPF